MVLKTQPSLLDPGNSTGQTMKNNLYTRLKISLKKIFMETKYSLYLNWEKNNMHKEIHEFLFNLPGYFSWILNHSYDKKS